MRLIQAIVLSAAAAFAYVPPHMALPPSWTDNVYADTVSQASALSVVCKPSHISFASFLQLIPLEFKSEAASALEESPIVSESACMSASDVIAKHSGGSGSIAFAVRRPGQKLLPDLILCTNASSLLLLARLF